MAGGGHFLVLLLVAVPFSYWDTHAALHTDLLLVPAQGLAPRLLPGYLKSQKNAFLEHLGYLQGATQVPQGAGSC